MYEMVGLSTVASVSCAALNGKLTDGTRMKISTAAKRARGQSTVRVPFLQGNNEFVF
jgi:hypothetical protein